MPVNRGSYKSVPGYARLLKHLGFLMRYELDEGLFRTHKFPPKKKVVIEITKNLYPELAEFTEDQICDYVLKFKHRFPTSPRARYIRRQDMRGHFVYIIGNKEFGRCKIGYSQDVSKRLAQLQTGCPFDLEVLALFPDKGRDYEAKLHARAAPYALRGEWFRIEGRLKEYLDSLHDT